MFSTNHWTLGVRLPFQARCSDPLLTAQICSQTYQCYLKKLIARPDRRIRFYSVTKAGSFAPFILRVAARIGGNLGSPGDFGILYDSDLPIIFTWLTRSTFSHSFVELQGD